MTTPQYLYFVPQIGRVSSLPIRSNFYVFRLPPACLAKIELGVENAQVDGGTLMYKADFLRWLQDKDTNWDQSTGLEE